MQLAPSRQYLNLLSQPLFLTLKWPLANLFSISSTLSGSYLLGWVHLLYLLEIWGPAGYGRALCPFLLGICSMMSLLKAFIFSLVSW